MNFSEVTGAAYAAADRKSILCTVELPTGQSAPHMAVDGDPESQQLFNDLVAGKYGAIVPYAAPVASADDLRAYANAKQAKLAATARAYSLGSDVGVMADVGPAALSNLQALQGWGDAHPEDGTQWIDDAGNVTALTGAQGSALGGQALAYWQSLFPVLGEAMNGISAGSIAANADIDALPWPT